MSYNVVISADFGAANTGKTVYGKLFDTTGVQVGSTITTGFVEATAGLYVHVLACPDGQEGVFVAYDSANTALRRSVVVAPRETENADVKSSTLATPANVTDTQTAITNAIATLNNLSQVQAQTAAAAALTAYDPPTKAELDAAQSAITATIPGVSTIAAAVMAAAVETGHDVTTVLRAVYAVIRGRSVADDAADPTEIIYYAPDDTTARVTHALTDTERTVT